MQKRLLLISNSTMAGEAYLGWPQQYIIDFLSTETCKEILFIPYAGVGLSEESLTASYDVYEEKVASVFKKLGYTIKSIHHASDPIEAVKNAEAIAVGGGNTFHLVGKLHEYKIMNLIKERVENGMPYMGWSAGSNVACPSLMTTNDMPIYQPESFNCMHLIPFQINPHYLDKNPEGHGGETREQRIDEFLVVNRKMTVVGLREACLLQVEGDKLELKGAHSMRIFNFGKEKQEVEPGSDIQFLM